MTQVSTSLFIHLFGQIISLCTLYGDARQANLNLKAPITTAADNIDKYFFFFFFSEKIRLDISFESSARQRIHMKLQALFSLKNKSNK